MPSLLAYVALERLRTLLAADQRNSGRSWLIDRTHLPEPQLDRISDDDNLFVFTIDGGRAVIVATIEDPDVHDGRFVGGDALLRDYDITDILPRLGCMTTTTIEQWAAPPRILPPGDVDLLRYTLALNADLARPPAPPEPIVDADAMLDSLRAAVYADPGADEPRAIYADYLQSRGDPRGELVALQLARARSGGPISDRERVLVERYGAACCELQCVGRGRFELERGFPRAVVTSDAEDIPDDARHPAWATIDVLSTTRLDVLFNPHLRVRRLHLVGHELAELARAPHPLPFEALLGVAGDAPTPSYREHNGVSLGGAVDDIFAIGALRNVRVLSIAINWSVVDLLALVRSPLGRQLEHLDLFVTNTADPPNVRDALQASELPVLTVRFALMPPSPAGYGSSRYIQLPQAATPDWLRGIIGFQRSSREPILRLQLGGVPTPDQTTELMRLLAQVTRGIQRIELHDLDNPRDVEVRYRTLVERLETMFARVVVRASDSMAP
jgi:uncharacterized protein (TIGR02996 family)